MVRNYWIGLEEKERLAEALLAHLLKKAGVGCRDMRLLAEMASDYLSQVDVDYDEVQVFVEGGAIRVMVL